MLHMVPDKKNPVGRKLLMKWIAGCRFALAFQQMHLQSEMRLTHEIVEADGSKSLTNHKSSKTWSLARGKRKLSEEHKAALERQQKKLPLAGFARRVANNSRARGSGKKNCTSWTHAVGSWQILEETNCNAHETEKYLAGSSWAWRRLSQRQESSQEVRGQ